MEQPPVEIALAETIYGRTLGTFLDLVKNPCLLQETAYPGGCLQIGVNREGCNPMHLTRAHVAALLPLLTRFVETGSLEEVPK
jgi:hypothetical protein